MSSASVCANASSLMSFMFLHPLGPEFKVYIVQLITLDKNIFDVIYLLFENMTHVPCDKPGVGNHTRENTFINLY